MLRKLKNIYNFHDHKNAATPFDSSVHLLPMNNDDEIFNKEDCASIIGSLHMLLIIPDLTLHMQ